MSTKTEKLNPAAERNAKIVETYTTDPSSTLESIGASYGLTRERVRQIVRNHIGASKTAAEVIDQRNDIALQSNKKRVAELVSSDPTVDTLEKLAKRLGLTTAYLNANIDALADSLAVVALRRKESQVSRPRTTEKTYTDEDVYRAVRRISKLHGGKPLTTPMYRESRRNDEPSVSLIQLRMGSILNAAQAANVPFPASRAKRSLHTEETVTDAMQRCAKDLGFDSVRLLSYAEYSDWASQGNGPSGSRVRQIFGNWNAAKMKVTSFS